MELTFLQRSITTPIFLARAVFNLNFQPFILRPCVDLWLLNCYLDFKKNPIWSIIFTTVRPSQVLKRNGNLISIEPKPWCVVIEAGSKTKTRKLRCKEKSWPAGSSTANKQQHLRSSAAWSAANGHSLLSGRRRRRLILNSHRFEAQVPRFLCLMVLGLFSHALAAVIKRPLWHPKNENCKHTVKIEVWAFLMIAQL